MILQSRMAWGLSIVDRPAICEKIATPGKGITATDEAPAQRGHAQHMATWHGLGSPRVIGAQAAILDPETLYQKDDDGVPFPKALEKRNIIPGVKPHLKVYELPGTPGDTVMQGLDSLAQRCKEYKEPGGWLGWNGEATVKPR
eukprot:Skav207163  [mRNA]  locus=scaffold573:443040:447028:- [translate_table: standard]